MKKIINILTLIILFCVVANGYTTVNITHKWQNDNVTLELIDNYGTPLSENIRAINQAEEAYHIFNLLSASNKKINLKIYPSEIRRKLSGEKASGLSVNEVEEFLDINISNSEKFHPIFDGGKLVYLIWEDGYLNLKSNGALVFRSENSFNLLGKKGDNFLIRKDGKLLHLSEADWLYVSTLKDFTASNVRWIDEDTIFCYVERDVDGKRFLALTSIRRPVIKLIEKAPGKFYDMAISQDRKSIYSLTFEKGRWSIYEYNITKQTWLLKRDFENRIFLMGVRGERLLWWDENKKEIYSFDGALDKKVESLNIMMSPRGIHLYGEEEFLTKIEAERKIILFGYGKKIDKFNSNPEIWIIPNKDRGVFEKISGVPGSMFLSLENMKLYYDVRVGNLRQIKSIELKVDPEKRYIFIILGFVLLAVVIVAIKKIKK